MVKAGIEVEIGHEPFKFANLYMLILLVKDTMPLTLPFMRTDTATHCRQITPLAYNLDSIPEITLSQFRNPFRNLIIHRARFLALCHFTIKTSLSLPNSLGDSKAFIYFLKIRHNH